jgi:hypothetical protein
MPREKTAMIHIRVDEALKKASEQVAKEDHRTLTSLIETLLTNHLREFGRLPSGKPAGKRK